MHSTTSQMSTRDRIGAILRVTSGNFLEQFDFFLFGFYATYIAHTFFPASSEFASLMMTFAVFGAGFLMRPIGAIVLGAYIDKVGRRKGLIVTLSIMATGTFLIVLILLSDHWSVGAAAGADRPSAAGLFRRRRAGRGVGLSGRDRHPGPQRLLHQLAVGQSAGCHHGGSRDGLCPQRGTGAERYQRLGLAYSVPFRLPDCSVHFYPAP